MRVAPVFLRVPDECRAIPIYFMGYKSIVIPGPFPDLSETEPGMTIRLGTVELEMELLVIPDREAIPGTQCLLFQQAASRDTKGPRVTCGV
jgi:hypothetical protein